MKKLNKRIVSVILAIVICLNIIDVNILKDGWNFLRAYASSQDYSVGFKWDVSELILDGQADYDDDHPADPSRYVELSNGGKTLKLTEVDDENPVLKTTFSFNLKKAIDPGNLTFTISGLDDLIRDGSLVMSMNDPNLVKTWNISRVEADGDNPEYYVFTNKVRVTSNNETTFTWQFNAREAVNLSDIELKTSCVVTEVEIIENDDGTTTEKREDVTFDTPPLTFQYESVHDVNEVKIVAQKIEDLDANNLNVNYDWRSYYSVIGLEGLQEYKLNPSNHSSDLTQAVPTNDDEEAHYIGQIRGEQEENRHARDIRKADYFIEVKIPEGLTKDDIMVVDRNGYHVSLSEYTITTQSGTETVYGFYDFKSKTNLDLIAGESYSSVYRVGILNEKIPSDSPVRIDLKGHLVVTYDDESVPVDITDTAAHSVSKTDTPYIGDGNWIDKHNKYEINTDHWYADVRYGGHAKHYNPQYQLLYDTIFNGKVVTYHLDASTKQYKTKEEGETKATAKEYDLIFEDAAPSIQNLDGKPDRVLEFDEYDFTRVKVEKLVDGNTVDGEEANLHGFYFDLYGRTETGAFTLLKNDVDGHSGNTIAPTELFLPNGIDEIKIVIRDLNIRTRVDVSMDVRYNVSMDDYDAVYIDTSDENDYVVENFGKARWENTNKGTRLVNTFNRKQYVGTQDGNGHSSDYDINNADSYTYRVNDRAHSNTWLRDTTTVIDSSAFIEDFKFHDALAELIEAGETLEEGYEPSDYYSTVITAGGTFRSDSEMGLNHFIVYSKLPDHVSPSEGWLDVVKDSFQFSAVLQGTGEEITAKDVFDENAVSFYYDAATDSVCAEFNFDAFALKMDDLTSCTFSYPAEISLAQVKAKNEAIHNFTTETYVTVLDSNVKLSPAENKTLLIANNNPYNLDVEMSKSSAKVTISAMGSQRSNEATKSVKSYYNNWVYDNSTKVDGNNTDYLDTDTNRMTSEYTYQMAFHRLTSENEHIIDPVMVDIVEDSKTSAWLGRAESVSFDEDSFPAGSYEPEVYYLLRSSSSVETNNSTEISERYDYVHSNETIKNAVEHFQQYGTATSSDNDTYTQEEIDKFNEDLEYYNTLKTKIYNGQEGWVKATQSGTEWLIHQDNVYAVAVIFKGDYVVPNNYLKITANLNMRAPSIVNDSSIQNVINNRATYNDCHFFAMGKDKLAANFPMYSVSNRTLVILNHSVELEKVSAKSGKRLTGAAFSVYNNGDCTSSDIVQYYDFNRKSGKNEIKTMEDMLVNLSGILTLNLAPGIFYYKETVAPKGFNKDEKAYRFRVISDANSVYYYSVDLKTDVQMNQEYLVVNNEEYTKYQWTVYAGKSVVLDSKEFRIYDSYGNVIDKFMEDASGEYTYDSADGNITNISCNDGKVKISSLPAGSYFIGTASNDPDGYSFSVADKSSVTFRLFNKSVIKSDVGYEMFKKSGSEITANDEQCWFTGGNGTYTLATSADEGAVNVIVPNSTTGQLKVDGLDSSSGYYLLNAYVPEFFKSSNQAVFELSGETEFTRTTVEQLIKTGRIVVEDDPIESANAKFQKIDGTEGNLGMLISDAEYSMYLVENDGSETKLYFRFDDSTKTYIYVGTSGGTGLTANLKSQEIDGKNGQFMVDKIGYGVYFVQEAVAPAGYQLDPEKYYFRVSSSTIDENGQLRFGNSIEGYGESDEGSESGETNSNTMDILSLNDSEVLSTIELNKTEEANPDVYLGYATYKLFRLNSEYETEEGLEEAKEASANSRGNTTSEAFTKYWTLKKNVATDISGRVTIRSIPFGTYLLYEDQPPKGYKWNNDSAQWETWTEMSPTHEKNNQIIVLSPDTLKANSIIRMNDEGKEEITYYSFYAMHRDERKTGEARLLKQNASGNALTDGNFTLYQVNFTDAEKSAAIARYKHELTVEQYNALDSATQQSYLDEVTAMDASDRKTVLEKIMLTSEDVIISEHIENGKPKTVSSKTIDTIMKQNLKTSYVPSIGATETISGLDWGVYYFYEVKAPAGYRQDTTPQFFNVNANNVGSTIEVHMTDDKTYGKIWLYKQAKAAETDGSHIKLFGAQFNLYTKNNEQVYAVPRLRLGGLTNETEGLSNDQKEFLVTGFTVVDKSNIKFNLENGYSITVTYEETDAGKITSVTPDTKFRTAYGDAFVLKDTRLTYYTVNKEQSQVYDDDLKKYRDITSDERDCVTDVYVTADEGGQLCMRGLDWASYYFREIIPPEGYGLADDVIFTVNAYNCDNQFLPCEDPKAQAAIIIDKEIPDASYFKAYGDPTFMFKIYGLEETTGSDVDYTKGTTNYKKNGKDFTLAIHLSDQNTIGTAMVNVPVGHYLIEELPVSRYECTGLEMLSGSGVKVKSAGIDTLTSDAISDYASRYDINDGTAVKPWTAFCDLTCGDTGFGEMLVFHVKYTNDIKRYDNFSHVSFADNQIPGQEYITAFKPIYEPLVPVSNKTDSYTYTIDLAEALANDDFSAALSYNTEKTAWIDSFEHIRFSTSGNSPVEDVSFDGTTLSFTVSNPVALAGQSIKLDVGYSDAPDFTVYDEEDTNMIKGELYLTFSEAKADVRKRVVLRNDVTNKTYFPYSDTNNQTKDITSVAMVYTKDADNDNIVKTMENPDYTADLTLNEVEKKNYKIVGWYLLDNDGRPVLDSEGNVLLFTMDEIEKYIFTGKYPAYLNLPDADVDNINTFTFQAEVDKKSVSARFVMKNDTKFLALLSKQDTCISGRINDLTSSTMTAFKEGNQEGWERCDDDHRLTYDSYGGNYTSGDPYPDLIRFYNIGTEVYWYTVDRTTLKPTNGSVYLEYNMKIWNQYSNLFKDYSALTDVSGMYDWDFSGVDLCGWMFGNTKITEFTMNRTYKKSGFMYMNRMFINCGELKSVTMDIDTSEAQYTLNPTQNDTSYSAQTKEMFNGCGKLRELNMTGDFTNIYNVQKMFFGCSELTANEFKNAFSNWKWNTDQQMQPDQNDIFNGWRNASGLGTTEFVDANGNRFKKSGNAIIKAT